MTSPEHAFVVREDGPWTHRDISANGIRFHIAEAGRGPLVVLLHGFAQYWWSWRSQLDGLSREGFRVVAPDLRGYGDTDKPPRGYDAFTLAADVAGLIRALGERDAVLVGHGYGGVLALDAATISPEQVRGVVAIAAPHPARMARVRLPRGADRYGRLLAWAASPVWPERRLVASGGAMVERLVRSQSGPAWKGSRDFRRTMLRLRRAIQIQSAAHCACEHLRWVARSPWRADGHRHREALAGGTPGPVLHLLGEADRFTPMRALADAARYCTGPYQLRTVPGVGHYPAEEAPAAVNALVAEFAARS